VDGGPISKTSPDISPSSFRESRPRVTPEPMPAVREANVVKRDQTPAEARPRLTPEPMPAVRDLNVLKREQVPAAPLDRDQLLRTRIKDLALQIAGTKVEQMVESLYRELAAVGVAFRPPCYLSDEWGCPDNKPIIGLPFYLADEKLGAIEGEVNEVREDEKESMIYLRHEAGHAFCYAYELYNGEDFLQLFGPYTRPYLEDYKVQPFSRSYVRHVPGWYAQKHPDEDFAETFAVFITPGMNWRKVYEGWPALRKLEYVEARVKEYGSSPPLVISRAPELPDVPVETMEETVGEVFLRDGPPAEVAQALSAHFDGDLRHIFEPAGAYPVRAADVIESGRKQVITSVAHWTGLARPTVKAIVLHLISRCRELDLTARPGTESDCLSRFSVLVTTLAMNRMYSGRFCEL